jgi:hypothetical protein
MTWYYNGEPFEDDGTNFGFVYLIENLITGKKYIGRKYFSKAGTKQVNGKKRKIRKSSDWATYYGSNETLKEDVSILGVDKFVRTILHLCKSKSECSYLETKEIFARDALLSDEYYNSWVTCKITSKHLASFKTALKNAATAHK